MITLSVRVEGADELAAKLDPGKVDGVMKPFMQSAGKAVEIRAKPLATVDTGLMKQSIHTEVKSARLAEVLPTPFYSIYQELGTSRGVPAVHFMRDGARSAVSIIRSLCRALVKELVRL